MMLSTHFSLQEMTASETAARHGIDNTPSLEVASQLTRTAMCLELIRTLLQYPIHISSGFRCLALNEEIGSKPTSQHVTGHAVDFTCPQYGDPRQVMTAIFRHRVEINYDQLILEFYNEKTGSGWVHISFTDTPRVVSLTIDQNGTRAFT